jgi:hypothetical protein
MENKQIAIQQPKQVSFPTEGDWNQIVKIGTSAFRSGLLPTGIKSTEAATIIALKAWEIGVPPMMAFQHMHVIGGKPGYSAELMQYLVRKNLPGIQITIMETSDVKASIKILRPERGSVWTIFTFTIEDAKKAGLLVKDIWKQYPGSMLFSRCISLALKKICPDALMGCSYTPDEVGANVGEFIDTTGTVVEPPLDQSKDFINQTKDMINQANELAKDISSDLEEIKKNFPPNAEPAKITVIGTDQRGSFPQDPEKPKPENLTEEDMQLLQKTMNECEINKQDVMHFCHTEFKKPFLAITQDEFKKLLEALKLICRNRD